MSKAQPLAAPMFDMSKAHPIGAGADIAAPSSQLGPAGQPNPQNVYSSNESDADVQARLAQHPIVKAFGEGIGETLGDVKNALNPVNIAKGIWDSFPPVAAYKGISNSIPVVRAYEAARSAGKNISDSLAVAENIAKQRDETNQMIEKATADFKKNPGQETVHALGDAALLAASFFEGPQALADRPAAAPLAQGEGEAATASATIEDKPGLVKQVVKGEDVAQPQAQGAIKEAVGKATTADTESQDLISGNETIVDDHFADMRTREQAAYRKVDDTVGFDLKAEKAQLANDQYKLKQLGNTDADVTQRGNLTEAINDSTDRIAEAEQKLKDAGIDPTEADTLHKSRMAGNDFKKALIKNVSSDGQSVNIDGMLNSAKALRFSKYGDRLEQFFGSHESADEFMNQLESAQKLGVHAMKVQRVAKWLGGVVGAGTLIGAAEHVAGAMTP